MISKYSLLAMGVILLLGSAPVFGEVGPEYPCYRLAAAPVMDGKADDAAWQQLPEAGGFFIYGGKDYAVEKQTVFRAGWTADSLYLCIKCFEPLPEKMAAAGVDGGNLWMDDSIEMFFQPAAGPEYFQLVANSAGARWNAVGPDIKETKPWKWEVHPGKWEKGWLLEVRIPFDVLEKTPKGGETWPVNIARNMTTGPDVEKAACWPPLQKGYNDRERFGRFVFSAEAPSAQQAKKYFKEQCAAKAKAVAGQPELMAALTNPALAAEAKPIQELLAQLADLPARSDAELRDMVGMLAKLRKPMDGLTEKARQLGIPLLKIPRTNLVLKIEARQAKEVKLWVNGQPVNEQAGQWPVSIREGLNVIAMAATADGETPGLRLRIPGQPELESRWRVGAATNDSWLTGAFDDRSWKKVERDKEGCLLLPQGPAGAACFRQIVLWSENHYSGLPCLQPKVREWGFSEKSMETLFHVLYSPPPLTFALEDYEFVLDVPKGFSLLEEKYPDDYKGGKLNRRPWKVTVEKVKHDSRPYTRYRFAFESAFVQTNNTQCALIPLLLNRYKGADRACRFYFRRMASGNLTELEQVLPVRVLPPLNGRMPKKVMIEISQWMAYLSGKDGGGQLFPEQFEAHMRQSMDIGFNSWFIAPSDGAYGKKVQDRVVAGGGKIVLWGSGNYPLWGNTLGSNALGQFMLAAPEARARYFNETGKTGIEGGQCCRSFVTSEGAARFKEAVKKDIGLMLNGSAELNFIGFPKTSIYFADFEQVVWRAAPDKSYCFCERCKTAFRQYAKLADTVDLSDNAIFTNYNSAWSSFRNQLDGRMNGIVREACNELGLKYMFYNMVHLRESFECSQGKMDIAFPGWPGSGQAVGSGTQEDVAGFAVTQRSLDEVMTFFHEKVGVSQIMGQLFASAYPYNSTEPWNDWGHSSGAAKDGFLNAKRLKPQILRVVAAFHGGVDLNSSLERCAGQQYYIGEATRIIGEYEDLFWSGERADQLAVSEQIKYPNLLVLRKDKERLVLLFNEGSQPIRVILQNRELAPGQKARIIGINQVVERPEKMELSVAPEDVAVVHIQ